MRQIMSSSNNNNNNYNNVISADSKSANANTKGSSGSSKLARIEAKIERDMERVVQKVDGELWYASTAITITIMITLTTAIPQSQYHQQPQNLINIFCLSIYLTIYLSDCLYLWSGGCFSMWIGQSKRLSTTSMVSWGRAKDTGTGS